MSGDVAASVKARLLKKAKESEEQFELFLVRYVCERFLYRLGASAVRDRCTLKGAGLLAVWMEDPYLTTRDVDLLASGASDAEAVRATMETICRVPCPEDGLLFDLTTLSVTPIRDKEKYAGHRAIMHVYLGKARIRLQVDLGFGDALSVAPEKATLPTLIGRIPSPVVLTYPLVVAVAEKFQAMVQLGRGNSRMKDFHDVWALSEEFAFEGASLREAVARCFARRDTPPAATDPDAMTPAFYADPDIERRWRAYLRKHQFRTSPPENMSEIGDRVRGFLGPVRESIVHNTVYDDHWPPGGPWRLGTSAPAGGGGDV